MKKRHHFVPQSYLRRFANFENGEEIWTYDMEIGNACGSKVKNTAYEKYLYSVTLEDGLPPLSEISGEQTKLLNRMRAIYAKRFLFGPQQDSGVNRLGAKYKDSKPGLKMSGFGPGEYSPVELSHRGKE